jgi:hypothetical protein
VNLRDADHAGLSTLGEKAGKRQPSPSALLDSYDGINVVIESF